MTVANFARVKPTRQSVATGAAASKLWTFFIAVITKN